MRAAAGLLGAALLLGACSPGAPEPRPTPSTPLRSVGPVSPVPMTVASGTCPDVSGALLAANGVVSVGPFSADELGPLPVDQPGRKLWVASQRPGRDTAELVVTGPDGTPRRQRRPNEGDVSAGSAQFWPGGIDTPVPGAYRIELTVGDESLCVVVVYG